MLLNPSLLSAHLGRTEKLTDMGTTVEVEEVAGPGTNGFWKEGEGLKHVYTMVRHESSMPIFTCHIVLTLKQTEAEECWRPLREGE